MNQEELLKLADQSEAARLQAIAATGYHEGRRDTLREIAMRLQQNENKSSASNAPTT